MAGILFKKVRKSFKAVQVIKDLDLIIEDGEFFTFVGPSGCGKSTILNMIAGLESVTGGQIYFDNTVVNDLSPQERDVAMVFQSYALYPHMSVYENIAFPLRMKKVRAKTINEEVNRVAEVLDLNDLLQRKPKELSGGQRQRVALGRAIIRRPKVFLMDEPLSNLDARLRIEMRAELKKLHQELKTTTVYVTHDQAEAMSLSGRIAVLNKGDVQQCGTPLEVYLKPANIFIGGFIGSPPMNFLNCSVQRIQPLKIHCNGILISPVVEHPPQERNVIIGIRPEDISVTYERSKNSIEVSVVLLEPAGSFNWVDFMWNGTKMKGTSMIDTDIPIGGRAFAGFPMDKIAVFDAASGNRI
jgi:multiple sugar transport system ATP-binding protein